MEAVIEATIEAVIEAVIEAMSVPDPTWLAANA